MSVRVLELLSQFIHRAMAVPNHIKINKLYTGTVIARPINLLLLGLPKNLFSFIFAEPSMNLIVFCSARPGHDV